MNSGGSSWDLNVLPANDVIFTVFSCRGLFANLLEAPVYCYCPQRALSV